MCVFMIATDHVHGQLNLMMKCTNEKDNLYRSKGNVYNLLRGTFTLIRMVSTVFDIVKEIADFKIEDGDLYAPSVMGNLIILYLGCSIKHYISTYK